MPRSPRRRVPSCHRRFANWRCKRTRLGRRISAKLDCSNDSQDHTVLPYADFPLSPQRSMAACTRPPTCWRDESSAPFVWRAVNAHGVRLNPPPALPSPLAPGAAASTAFRPTNRDDVRSPLLPGRNGRRRSGVLPDGKSDLFFARGLDRPNHVEMVREISSHAHAIFGSAKRSSPGGRIGGCDCSHRHAKSEPVHNRQPRRPLDSSADRASLFRRIRPPFIEKG